MAQRRDEDSSRPASAGAGMRAGQSRGVEKRGGEKRGRESRGWRCGRVAAALVAALAIGACGPQPRNHGYAPGPEELAEIAVGRDTRETVAEALGPPTSSGVLPGSSFYYVAQSMEQYGFREPQVLSRRIVAVGFDDRGVVRDIEQLDLRDGEVVAFQRRVTDAPTEGIGLLRQLGSNLGRIGPTSGDPLN